MAGITHKRAVREYRMRRAGDEALRLVNVYVNNRITALEFWERSGRRDSASRAQVVRKSLSREIRSVARSLPDGHSLTHMMHSFADNLEQIWVLPDPIALVRRMHRELDPEHKHRSLVPEIPEESRQDLRYAGGAHFW